MTDPVEVYLALGTNLGDRANNLADARDALKGCARLLRESSLYETPPWGVTEQPAFLNQVLKAETSLPPHELLAALKKIEKIMGRVPSVRYGPRLIDIDILLYGRITLESPELVIPHPRMFERAFVLVPLCEIAPDLRSPLTGQPLVELLKTLDTSGITRWEDKVA
jgi:2-amino-4-hydroxy-6-hydroxymethyldihydropteridine diphosphokinase